MAERLFGLSRFEAGMPVVRAKSGPPSQEMCSHLTWIAQETDTTAIDQAQSWGLLTGSLHVMGVRI